MIITTRNIIAINQDSSQSANFLTISINHLLYTNPIYVKFCIYFFAEFETIYELLLNLLAHTLYIDPKNIQKYALNEKKFIIQKVNIFIFYNSRY